MAKYMRKPPVVDAMQFTGGAANAKAVIEGLSTVIPGYSVKFIPASSEFGLHVPSGTIVETRLNERIRIENIDGVDKTVNVGDWIVFDRDLGLKVLSPAEFAAQYQSA